LIRQTSVAVSGLADVPVRRNSKDFRALARVRPGSTVAPGAGVSFGRITYGLLTYFAVSAFGHGVEGNPILATWMTLAGAGPTLLVAKLGACACGLVLYARGTHRALATLTAIYLLVAVAPWLYFLSIR
jgi:hypothetical protein